MIQHDLSIATSYPLPIKSIGVVGDDHTGLKERLISFLEVVGYQVIRTPLFNSVVVVFGECSIKPEHTDTVIHISQISPEHELPFKRYIRLIPSNLI